MPLQIVIDTNVFVSALRSKRGASFKLMSLVGKSTLFEVNVSVPLVLEYEDVAKRPFITGLLVQPPLPTQAVNDIIDYICSVANRRQIHFLWRPFLRDPKDDMVLELSVAAQCEYIISFNKRDFVGVEQFGLQVLTPGEFLQKIGES